MTATQPPIDEADPPVATEPGACLAAVAGEDALAVLGEGSGTVDAVFRRSLYLRAGDGLLCVGDGDLVRGPLNLCLLGPARWRFPAAAVSSGAPWRYRQGALSVGGTLHWRLDGPVPWAPEKLPLATRDAVMRGIEALRPRVAGPRNGGGSEHIASRALDAGTAVLERWLVAALVDEAPADEIGDVPADALALLGCGPGLTPSGDDILVGVLVTLGALGAERAARRLRAAIRDHVSARTGRISAAHLASACRGQAVAPVHDVLRALVQGDARECARAGEWLEGYGHSSGADAMRGILLAADVWVRSLRGAA